MSDPPDEMVKYYGKYNGDWWDVPEKQDFPDQENNEKMKEKNERTSNMVKRCRS